MVKRRRGELSAEDRALWRQVSDGARPLSHRAEHLSHRAERLSGAPMPALPPRRKTAVLGDGAATRRRRGRTEPDSRLDLHGLTQAAAHARLDRFLAGAGARGYRCILVITGKGSAGGSTGSSADLDAPFMRRPGPGVLRALVPAWLGEGDNRGRVLSHQPADPRHGGAGALYVFLRRRRPIGEGPGR